MAVQINANYNLNDRKRNINIGKAKMCSITWLNKLSLPASCPQLPCALPKLKQLTPRKTLPSVHLLRQSMKHLGMNFTFAQ